MDTGIATYVLANHILADRRREAESRRLAADVRAAARADRAQARARRSERWSLEWAASGFTGKPVTLVNVTTGEKTVGRDPGDWDKALGRAMKSATAESRQLVGSSLLR
jgi:hypothetical protein